jgi:hypothetical protein
MAAMATIACAFDEVCSPDDDPILVEARLRRMTRMLVRRHREAIRHVAALLLARSRLSADEIAAGVFKSGAHSISGSLPTKLGLQS